MVFVLKQKPIVAENRSLLIAAFVLIYMIVFGHGLPTSINKNLFNKLIDIYFFLTILLSLVLPIVSINIVKVLSPISSDLLQRLDLAFIAGKIISNKFWLGVGLGNLNFKGCVNLKNITYQNCNSMTICGDNNFDKIVPTSSACSAPGSVFNLSPLNNIKPIKIFNSFLS